MPTKYSEIEKTAYHEAGHVVIHHFLGVEYGNTTIIPNKDEGYAGCVESPRNPDTHSADVDSFYRELTDITCPHCKKSLAVRPSFNIPTAGDGWIYAHNIFSLLAGAAAQKKLTGRWPHPSHYSPDYLHALRIANMDSFLPEDSDFSQSVVKAAHNVALFLIEKYWPEIKVVAKALLKKKTLTAQEVRKLVVKSYCKRMGIKPLVFSKQST